MKETKGFAGTTIFVSMKVKRLLDRLKVIPSESYTLELQRLLGELETFRVASHTLKATPE